MSLSPPQLPEGSARLAAQARELAQDTATAFVVECSVAVTDRAVTCVGRRPAVGVLVHPSHP